MSLFTSNGGGDSSSNKNEEDVSLSNFEIEEEIDDSPMKNQCS
jgi:hypothetical protein